MSEHNNESTAKRPDFIAYNVQDSRDGKGHWNRVGAAWQHRDGKGAELQLDSIPVDGRVTLRELREDRMKDYEDGRQAQAMNEPERSPQQSRSRERSR